ELDETDAVAVISSGYWQRQFNRSTEVLGRPIRLNGLPFTIIGVAAVDFIGEAPGEVPDIWASLALQTPGLRNDRGFSWLYLLGRLRPGVTPEQAQADLTPLLARARPASSSAAIAPRVEISAGARGLSGLRERFSNPLRLLMVIAVIVLLIACTNLASLL